MEFHKRKKLTLYLFLSSSIVPAICLQLPNIAQNFDTWMYLVSAASYGFVFSWFILDQRRLGYSASRLSKIGMVAIPVIVLPVYLITTRGMKQGFLAILKWCAVFVLYGLLMVLFLVLSAAFAEYGT